MKDNFYCVIMAGGVGNRFWPISRNRMPKQFLDILGLGKTFIQSTYDRFTRIVPKENILVVTSEQYRELVKTQLPDISDENILLEPYKRNTAPCIAYATYRLYDRCPDATVVVAPSDHFITDEEHFCANLSNALDVASRNDNLYTIGVPPTRVETNFGYIQVSKSLLAERTAGKSYKIKTFTEKPDAEMAKIFVETGEFMWNSGMFIWNLKTIKSELEKYLPEVASLFKSGQYRYYSPEESDFIRQVYSDCPSISIDYGVMEKTDRASMFLADFGWSDVGTWDSVYEHSPSRDEEGNIIKAGTSFTNELSGTIIKEKDDKKLVVVRGLKDFMVIDTDDVLLICPRSEKVVKSITTDLSLKEKSEYL